MGLCYRCCVVVVVSTRVSSKCGGSVVLLPVSVVVVVLPVSVVVVVLPVSVVVVLPVSVVVVVLPVSLPCGINLATCSIKPLNRSIDTCGTMRSAWAQYRGEGEVYEQPAGGAMVHQRVAIDPQGCRSRRRQQTMTGRSS